MRETTLTLLAKKRSPDHLGIIQERVERRTVLARRGPITRAEWEAAYTNGLRPQVMCLVRAADYHGEEDCELDGRKLGIYRTYERADEWTELYCERKAGDYGD